jgi:hypothetical protein
MDLEMSPNLRRLSEVRIFDYFKKRSMPEFVQPLVTELVTAFGEASERQRSRLLSEVPAGISPLLGWYARTLAGLSVRNRDGSDLRRGWIAVAIAVGRDDCRDLLSPTTLLYNSALKLGADPETLVAEISTGCPKNVLTFFVSFMGRPPELKLIGVFGFSEGRGPHGFDYIPLLPEFGGPTPF